MAAPAPPLYLERVLGLTSLANAAFAVDRATGSVAYAAGSTVVVYSPRRAKQVSFFLAAGPVAALSFAPNGEHLAAGTRGRRTCVQLWHVASGALKATLGELHSFGVAAVAFSPDGRLLATAGFKNDRALHVWDWRAEGGVGCCIASGKLSQRVLALSWRSDGAVLVTAGERHLKFWAMEQVTAAAGTGATRAAATGTSGLVMLTSKPAILSEAGPAFEHFVDVAFGPCDAAAVDGAAPGTPLPPSARIVYAITTGGMLCSFDEGRLMESWVHVRSSHAFSLDVTSSALYVGCADGVVRAFTPGTLAFRGTLPCPPAVGQANVSVLDALPAPSGTDLVPAAVAVRAAGDGRHVAVIYGDRSLFIWDCGDGDLRKVIKVRSLAGHAGPVWDIAFLPPPPAAPTTGARYFPDGTFATVSSDCTLRLWNLSPRSCLSRKEALAAGGQGGGGGGDGEADTPVVGEKEGGMDGSTAAAAPPLPHAGPRSVIMREQLAVMYLDDAAKRRAGASGAGGSPRAGSFAHGSALTRCVINAPFDVEAGGPALTAGLDVGARALAVHGSGLQLAVGDKGGNVALFDTSSCACVAYEPAHDAEVTSLSFLQSGGAAEPSPLLPQISARPAPRNLLATASRDRFVHVFDVHARGAGQEGSGRVMTPLATLPDHTSAVTCVAFTKDGGHLLSGGADSLLVFHKLDEGAHGAVKLSRSRTVTAPHGAILDFDMDAANRNLVAAGQDRRLHVWNLKSGKAVRSYRAEGVADASEAGVSRVCLDPSGLFVAAACGDRVVRLLDFYTGAVVARAAGHGEAVTGLAFSPDCRRLLTVGVDGVIFVWRLAPTLLRSMQARLSEISAVRSGAVVAVPPSIAVEPPAARGSAAVGRPSLARVRSRPTMGSVPSQGSPGVGAAVLAAALAQPGAPIVARSSSVGRSASRGRAVPPPVAVLPPRGVAGPSTGSPPAPLAAPHSDAGPLDARLAPTAPTTTVPALSMTDLDGPASSLLSPDISAAVQPAPSAPAVHSIASSNGTPHSTDAITPVEFRHSILPAWAQTKGVGATVVSGSSIEATAAGDGRAWSAAGAAPSGLRPTSRWAQLVGQADTTAGDEEDEDEGRLREEGDFVAMPVSQRDAELTRASFSVSRGPGAGVAEAAGVQAAQAVASAASRLAAASRVREVVAAAELEERLALGGGRPGTPPSSPQPKSRTPRLVSTSAPDLHDDAGSTGPGFGVRPSTPPSARRVAPVAIGSPLRRAAAALPAPSPRSPRTAATLVVAPSPFRSTLFGEGGGSRPAAPGTPKPVVGVGAGAAAAAWVPAGTKPAAMSPSGRPLSPLPRVPAFPPAFHALDVTARAARTTPPRAPLTPATPSREAAAPPSATPAVPPSEAAAPFPPRPMDAYTDALSSLLAAATTVVSLLEELEEGGTQAEGSSTSSTSLLLGGATGELSFGGSFGGSVGLLVRSAPGRQLRLATTGAAASRQLASARTKWDLATGLAGAAAEIVTILAGPRTAAFAPPRATLLSSLQESTSMLSSVSEGEGEGEGVVPEGMIHTAAGWAAAAGLELTVEVVPPAAAGDEGEGEEAGAPPSSPGGEGPAPGPAAEAAVVPAAVAEGGAQPPASS